MGNTTGKLVLAGTGIAAVALAWKVCFSKRRPKKRTEEIKEESDDCSLGTVVAITGVVVLGVVVLVGFIGALIFLDQISASPNNLSESNHESFTDRESPPSYDESYRTSILCDHDSFLFPDEICDSEKNAQREIKIMSYNLWHPGKNKYARMQAVTQLAEKHMPDVVLFQEVTPKMRKMLLRFQVWHEYKPFFFEGNKCIMVSGTMDASVRFTKGGKLHIINVELSNGKDLFIATSHLKCSSINSNQGKQDQDRETRMSQAQKFLEDLQDFQNIIFGGDMNWNNEDDDFPLEAGWVDAWVHMKPPHEQGYTFDTETNPELKGRKKKLRERLDRFLCKLNDFELVDIDIIGREEMLVPNGSVMISDHYGLILTIRTKSVCYVK